jgi:spermidine synthase
MAFDSGIETGLSVRLSFANHMTSNPDCPRRLVLLAVGALGVSCVMTQLALMRELLGGFAGNEMVLGVTLGVWLLWMGIGAGLGRASDKLRDPVMVLFLAQILVAMLPLAQVAAWRALRNVVFIRGAEVGLNGTVISTVILLMPYCVVAGYALALACSLLARSANTGGAFGVPPSGGQERDIRVPSCHEPPDPGCAGGYAEARGGTPNAGPPNRAAGWVYVADSLGSVAGGILFSFVLVRWFDHLALLAVPAILNLLAAGATGLRCGERALGTMTLALALVVPAVIFQTDLDGRSTAWLFQKQRVVARANSPYGKLVVTQSHGQLNFIENGVPLTSTRDDQHVEETVHYAMAQRPAAWKVLLVSGGISGTAREILKYGVAGVDYVELDPLLLELGRKYLPENLADPSSVALRRAGNRIRIINTDGRLFVKQTGEKYDVVIVDVPDPSTAQLNRFYTAEFLAEVKRVLSPDGLLSFSLGHYENYVSPELARLLGSARRSLQPSFTNVLIIPGGRVFFLASDGPLTADIAARLEQQQIQTKLVNRHYLEAMLTADRMADIERAAAQPAAVNRDFSPMLYFYHLRHWLSQYNSGFSWITGVLLVLFGVYLVRLRGAALVLFASGFAGSALELVLLLAFQVLCGSVYHQVGIVVTVFMAGLALGALVANRALNGRDALPRVQADRQVGPTWNMDRSRNRLALLAFAVAGFAVLLPFLLPLLNRLGGTNASLFIIKTVITVLTLGLAVLVGMQFPLANRLEFDGTNRPASRLYAADFIGAALGALLAGIWLIPVLGVTGTCLLTAGLNVLGGVLVRLRKAAI